jgi:Tfp pilus assembly protein PilX
MLSATDVFAVNNFGDTRSGGLAGPMGLFIILVLTIATVLLVRNMNARLRRLPDSFPDPAAERRAAEAARLEAEFRAGDPDARPDVAADVVSERPDRSERG